MPRPHKNQPIAALVKESAILESMSAEEAQWRLMLIARGEFDIFPKLKDLGASARLGGILEALKLILKVHGAFQAPSKNEKDRIAERKTIKKAALAIWKAAHNNPDVPNPTPEEVIGLLEKLELDGWGEYKPLLKAEMEQWHQVDQKYGSGATG